VYSFVSVAAIKRDSQKKFDRNKTLGAEQVAGENGIEAEPNPDTNDFDSLMDQLV
jgi:hypothetical protein